MRQQLGNTDETCRWPGGHHGPLLNGPRSQFESNFGDQAQCAMAASEELAKVVTRYVLHHLAAGFDRCAVSEDRAQADDKRSQRTKTHLLWTSQARRHYTAQRRATIIRRVNRQPLSPLTQLLLELTQCKSGFGCHHQIGRLMRNELRHPARSKN